MKMLHYTHYLYLALAVLFLYDAVERLQNGQNSVLSFLFAALAVFMFFFRRRFLNRMK